MTPSNGCWNVHRRACSGSEEGKYGCELVVRQHRLERRHRGEAMLDALKSLQLAQLGGGPQSLLAGLAELAVQGATASDPGLQAVVQAIAARAAVELARR